MGASGANPSLVKLVSALATPGDRTLRAAAVAAEFGAVDLLVVIRDEAAGAFLCAPGFRQTLPNGRAWREFLSICEANGEASGRLPFQSAGEQVPVFGFAAASDAVLVLVGTDAATGDIAGLKELLPLLVELLKGERALALTTLHARSASDAVERSRIIASTLERTRRQLEDALRAEHDARSQLERVNAELTRHALETDAANEQLLVQADELAAQAMEMELQANQLQATNVELDQARTNAEAANRTKGEFLATMSHELRTPLNAIGGYAELLAMGIHGPVTPAQSDALARVIRSQRHLLRLINDVLNLARLEAGRLGYVMATVPLSDAVADLAPMIDPQIAAKSLHFEVRASGPLPTVYADRERLQQVLLNLLSNSVKFTPKGGSVWIEAEEIDAVGSAPKVEIRVGDTGAGIPPEKMEWIFEPFTQVDSSHSRIGQGAGLGLAISRDLARGMGGDLNVVSEVGTGSVFTLTLERQQY